ncbi:hypothetical protein P171DRAFT_281864 [Karstenula rhodostoma CBS 690.94]|uniref:Uncharacterized protein n=1 Tax=Karstenula rhodostoma CBS 690.94 TaxID=1392251 RepID=A0A9P4UD25_9PLEO|nr:hypothetical protein P171DRAFT_281864 [Karstenula rhodostoma CBS 690.94]
MEDEIDLGDSPINSPDLRAADPQGFLTDFEIPDLKFQSDYNYPHANQESMELPVGEPFTPYLNGNIQFKPTISRVQRAKLGVHLNRRKPSREDYSNFVLYQASQRVYEVTFLKNFVAHALHPNQIDACLSAQDSREGVRQYLRSIADNVNKLATKIIWNTHLRTVRFMANDDKETTPFWDFRQFDDQFFANFSPGNAFPILGLMNQSWHRAFSHPSMVRYSARQYQVGPDASPFEEIDDVTGHTTLFEDRSAAHTASRDRVVRAPRTKKPKNQHLPGATLRENSILPRNDWIQGLPDYGAPGSFAFTENPGVQATLYDTSQDVLLPGVIPANGAQSGWGGAADGVDTSSPGSSSSVHMGNDTETTSVCTNHSPAEAPACLQSLVALHGPDLLLQEASLSPSSDNALNECMGKSSLWRMALIENHKQQLIDRWPQSQQPREAPLDFDGYVDRAIKNGDLKRLAPGLRRIANFVDPPTVAPSPNETQAGLQNNPQSHQPEVFSDEKHDLHTKRVLQQDSEAGNTSNNSARSKLRNNQLAVGGSNKRLKRAPKAKNSKTSKSSTIPKPVEATSTSSKSSTTPKPVEATSTSSSASSSPSSIPAQTYPYHGMSRMLEDDQQLPPNAYFEKVVDDEQPAWRCGIKHPMGHYYNAGDRKNCPGCFTASSANPKRKVMDFYLPSRSHFAQPAPGVTWKPGRPTGRPRRSDHLSHNSIAKDAYWNAINAGATTDEALKKGIEAVETYLQAKQEKKEKKEKKEPTPEPTPEPVDLGPHPSGSKTMEHGQNLPMGAYWTKQFRHDELAWRCDINHALGRYYLAGDVKSCPGCGSCRSGPGQHPQMDFYLPTGSIARQEAPGLVKWKPRTPYKTTKKSKRAKQVVTHNQFCSKKYWELIDEGREHVEGGANEEALALSIEATDAHIDAKVAAMQAKLEESESSEEEQSEIKSKGRRQGNGRQKEPQPGSDSPVRHSRTGARFFSLASSLPVVPRKRGSEVLNDSELDEVTEYESAKDEEEAQQETISLSSDDESTSDSDSE